MLEYRAEGLCRNANHLSREELSRCMASGEVLQSTALAYDTGHRLRFELGGLRGIMPFADCVDAAPGETVKDIAVLTRVGRPTCFVIMGTEFDDNGEEYYLLSRAEAQRRNASPADRVQVGQQLLCAIKNRDVQGRIVLTLRELLGTWSENAACFAAGETVVGIVRSVEEYGVFIEIAPNLAGLAEADSTLRPGQAVSVYIKNILPDKMKIKLVVVNKNLGQPLRFEPHYFVTRGRLKRWTYSTPQSRKQIETVF